MSVFEEMGGTYSVNGDYRIPNLALPEATNYVIGKYGRMYLTFIKRHKRVFYTTLLCQGELNRHLHEIDIAVSEKVNELVDRMAQQQGVTEKLKATDQMQWVGLMNNIRHCAEEMILKEVICM